MADTAQNTPAARKRSKSKFSGTGHYGSGYLGVTKDGVKILRPKGRVDNITLAQARRAVVAVRQAQANAVKSED